MGWRSWSASKRALACSAFFGIGAVLGMLPGLHADPVQTSPAQTNAVRSLSPAEVVASRFEANAIPVETRRSDSQPQGGGFALASAAEVPQILDPNPVYLLPQSAVPPAEPAAYTPPDEPTAPPPPNPPVTPPPPAKRAAPHPAPVSRTLLNNAQITNIRNRLKLTAYQDQLWPPVESALRGIDLPRDAKAKTAGKAGARAAAIDPNNPQVQRLKSAAVPLIMSFNDDQKQEVRTMLRLMGLESLATQF
jgi:hypothetical protein